MTGESTFESEALALVLAWDNGFMAAAEQDHPAYPRTRVMRNPYRDATYPSDADVQEAVASVIADRLRAVHALVDEWDSKNLTLPGHEGEPFADANYRAGFFDAVSIARTELRKTLEVPAS